MLQVLIFVKKRKWLIEHLYPLPSIEDKGSGSWGHINVDDIRFEDCRRTESACASGYARPLDAATGGVAAAASGFVAAAYSAFAASTSLLAPLPLLFGLRLRLSWGWRRGWRRDRRLRPLWPRLVSALASTRLRSSLDCVGAGGGQEAA